MSTVSITTSQNMLVANYDTTKLVLKGGEYEQGDYTNSSGSEVTLPLGTLLGRISSTGLIVPLTSGASDGSQYPIGILCEDVIVPDATTVKLSYVIGGEVEESLVKFDGSDDKSTVVDDRTLGDRIKSDNLGILLVASDELSNFDNQ